MKIEIAAIMIAVLSILGIIPPAKRFSFGGIGGRFIMFFSAGSATSAMPGKPSVTRLIQRMWIGNKGIGNSNMGAKNMVRISPRLQDSTYKINFLIFS